uniref:hypothetical protein n=1 Tax=uncultured Megasphaera sp. TaxID=165188 RepID=UPI00258C469D|nr:hypothetical protein [uncultured Megasphaera sp.]
MKRAASMGVFWCILFLVGGGIAGGILGDALSAASVGNVMPLLTRHYEIFDIENIAEYTQYCGNYCGMVAGAPCAIGGMSSVAFSIGIAKTAGIVKIFGDYVYGRTRFI